MLPATKEALYGSEIQEDAVLLGSLLGGAGLALVFLPCFLLPPSLRQGCCLEILKELQQLPIDTGDAAPRIHATQEVSPLCMAHVALEVAGCTASFAAVLMLTAWPLAQLMTLSSFSPRLSPWS